MRVCAAIAKNGTACRGVPMPHEEYCYAHHPDTKEERKEYGSKGGKRGGRGRQSPVTAELTRLQKKFEDLAAEVESGALDRGAAAVVCQLLNGARACVSTILKAKELEEIEQRIRELEQRYEERGASVRYGEF